MQPLHQMPIKPDELRAQIKLLEAAVKADKAERRAAEKPVRDARQTLMGGIRSALASVDRYNQIIANELHSKGKGWFCDHYKISEAEKSLATASALFQSRLDTLKVFDALHNVEAEDYPRLPVLDREATVAAGKADREAMMAKFRSQQIKWS